APGGDAERAIRYASRAAERATRLLAYEEAVRFYGAALEARDLAPGDGATRCDLLFGLGDAQWSSGDETRGWTTFLRAAEIARDLKDPERLGRAALGPGAVVVMFGLDIGFGAMS